MTKIRNLLDHKFKEPKLCQKKAKKKFYQTPKVGHNDNFFYIFTALKNVAQTSTLNGTGLDASAFRQQVQML